MKRELLAVFIFFLLFLTTIQISALPSNDIYDKINKIDNKNDFLDLLTLDNLIVRLMELSHHPSLSACIIKEDELIWSNSYGFSNIENRVNSSIDTAYLIASITKVVTATAIMQLYERNLINLSDDVNKYLDFDVVNPNYPHIPITFEMLLSHKSSLNFPPKIVFEPHYKQDPPSLDSWIESYFYDNDGVIKDRWRDEKPGTKYHYSNIGYTLLGYLVEKVTNRNFSNYCNINIFKPLNMDNSSFYYSELESNGVNIAKPYIIVDDNPYDIHIPLPYYSLTIYPAGGLWTTIRDLSHFMIAHMNKGVYKGKKILNESTIDYMHQNNLGWRTDKKLWIIKQGHSGSIWGFTSYMYVRINDNAGIITFRNMRKTLDKIDTIYSGLIELLLFCKARFYT